MVLRVWLLRHPALGMLWPGMAAKHSRHIALTEPLITYVEAQVANGEYTSASEFVRAALRLLIERDEAKARCQSADPEVVRDRV